MVKMYPYHFVAILGSDSEYHWAVLNGRSNEPVSREACRNSYLRLSLAHPIYEAADKPKLKKERKEGSDEKSRDCSRSSSGGSNLGAWHSPVAELLIFSKYYMEV